jgi:glyoxylase-like metal-dependent hydrolase (beta-lactamase superfamily II)
MTGPGTNTYLLGDAEMAVVDPGPTDRSHIDAILEACDGRLGAIFVTHTHQDHSPGAAVLAAETGAPMYGAAPPDDAFQDRTFVPEVAMTDDALYETPEWRLRAIHTPGHVGNHYCLLLEDDGILMTGDHIMNGSTVVIIPPSGDMGHYIRSLRRLLDYRIFQLAPGHGELMDNPRAVIDGIIEHRLRREAKVVDRLAQSGRTTIAELVKRVYDDVDEALHPMARLSLWAHLLKLEDEERARSDGEFWEPV